MTQDFLQILYDQGGYSKVLGQRMLRLYDQKLLDYNQEYPNLYFSRTGLFVCLKLKISFIKLGFKLSRVLKISIQSALRHVTFINETPDINNKSSYDVLMCCNFCTKTSEHVSEDFRFSLEKQHLKTFKLADNN